MPLLIKICGVTSAGDAAMAAQAGAGAIGVNLWSGSKRYVAPEAARAVLAGVPAGVLKVGVFVNAAPVEVARAMAELGLDRAQLHGDEQAADYGELDEDRVIKVVRVRDDGSMTGAGDWNPGLWLYDAYVDGFGGGGVAAPWPVVARAARRPFLLAGGLGPHNVADAIRATRPDGVDVASGVERSPGVKDLAKVAAFVAAARAAL